MTRSRFEDVLAGLVRALGEGAETDSPDVTARVEQARAMLEAGADPTTSVRVGEPERESEVSALLISQRWVGNVRELKNADERAVIFCEGDEIRIEHLPSHYQGPIPAGGFENAFEMLSREMILDALRRAGGKKQLAAELLNVHRKTLYNKIMKYGLGRSVNRKVAGA